MNALTKSSPEFASSVEDRVAAGGTSRWSTAFDAWITLTPTSPRRSSALSILTRSSRCWSSDVSALGSSSSAESMLSVWSFAEIASRLSDSIAFDDVGLVRVELGREAPRSGAAPTSWSPRGPRGRGCSSCAIVLSWATPPPLSSRLSAPRTSSTSGFRPVRSRSMTSPVSSGLSLAPSSGALSETNFSPSRLVWRISAIGVVGQLGVGAQLAGSRRRRSRRGRCR